MAVYQDGSCGYGQCNKGVLGKERRKDLEHGQDDFHEYMDVRKERIQHNKGLARQILLVCASDMGKAQNIICIALGYDM